VHLRRWDRGIAAHGFELLVVVMPPRRWTEHGHCSRRLGVTPMRSGLPERTLSRGPFLAFRFGLAPRREFALLRSEVRTGFQFVCLTDMAIEVNDFFLGLAFFRHKTASQGVSK
jgi:hypothetical protein